MIASYQKYAALRDAKGFKDISVADEINISRSAISMWKHQGKSDLKVSTVSAIAKLLGCEIKDLLEEKDGG